MNLLPHSPYRGEDRPSRAEAEADQRHDRLGQTQPHHDDARDERTQP